MKVGIWNSKTLEDQSTDVLEEVKSENQLIVFNDDVNTFDHVIACLVKYCGHGFVQAEQCAYVQWEMFGKGWVFRRTEAHL
jgi:ATP-dependent Clp protease adaptor protein ClpS